MKFWITFFWGSLSGNWFATINFVAGMRSPSEALPASSMYLGSGRPWHWNRGSGRHSWALFLDTMAPAGQMVQQIIPSGLAFLILVSWAVMSVSLGPKDSLATKVIP